MSVTPDRKTNLRESRPGDRIPTTSGRTNGKIALTVALVAALGLGAMSFVRWNSPHKARLFDELPGVSGSRVSASPLDRGGQIFLRHCSPCHQANGRGIPNVFPPLVGSTWVAGAENRIVRVVLNGASGPIEVGGAIFNNLMPPFRSALRDDEIALVLSYVRHKWGGNAPAVLPDTVAQIRSATASRTTACAAAELIVLP